MLSIRELRGLAVRVGPEEFEKQMGPFALIQRPPVSVLALAAERLGPGTTIRAQRPPKAEKAMGLILSFEELVVATLPPVRSEDTLVVGRLPDCDLVVENPSVSKRHAVLTWHGSTGAASVRDEGSANGTRIDERPIGAGEVPVSDGDVLSFGSADYWFMLSPSLYRRLVTRR